jgi:phospholipid-binding lipoprotein MlaA
MRLLLIVLMSVLTGCATSELTVRRLPPQTPAADNAAAVARWQEALAGIGAAAQSATGTTAPTPLTPAEAPSIEVYDPWERLNRFTYRFNARFDESVFFPVANGYRRMPGPIRDGVHNFFQNLAEVKSTVNYALQLRFKGGVRSLGRFVINSTVGLGGLFDVASRIKLSNEQTGFAATLSTWGVPPGPYLVIPIAGPSTVRDGVGSLADYGVEYAINLANLYRSYQGWALGVLSAVDERAGIDFRYYGSGSPFEYEFVRFLYVHREQIQDEALRKVGRARPLKGRQGSRP